MNFASNTQIMLFIAYIKLPKREIWLLFMARDAHLLRIPYENHGLQAASPSL